MFDEEFEKLEREVVEDLRALVDTLKTEFTHALGRIEALESQVRLETIERELETQLRALGAPYDTCLLRLLGGGKVIVYGFRDGNPPKTTTVEKLRDYLSNQEQAA